MAENGLWRVTFDTNPDDCNLSCIMCEDHSPYSSTKANRIKGKLPRRRMPVALIEDIFSEASQLGIKEIIPSTMGEPLIYPHFERILELCHAYKIKLNLTTNGTFPKKGAVQWSKLLVPITSDIKISFNGATKKTQETIMLGIKWEKVLENIKTLIAERDSHAQAGGNYCNLTLQLTFIKSNLTEIVDIVQLGIELGMDRIKGHQLWTHGFSQLEQESLRHDPASIKLWNTVVKEAHELANSKPLKNGKTIKLVNFNEMNLQASHDLSPGGRCPFLGKEAWVAPDGRFNPCCAPDKERQALGHFGNLNETSLTDIVTSKAYKDLCNNYMNYSVCKKCNMREARE